MQRGNWKQSWNASKGSELESLATDFELEKRLQRINSQRNSWIKRFLVFSGLFFVLAFSAAIFPSINRSFIVGACSVWAGSLLLLTIRVVPWASPRCSKCYKRTKSVKMREVAGWDRIYYVCRECRTKADSGVTTGD